MKISSKQTKKIIIFIFVICTMLGLFVINTVHDRFVKYTLYNDIGENKVTLTTGQPIYQDFNFSKDSKSIDALVLSPAEDKTLKKFDFNYEILYKGQIVTNGSFDLKVISDDQPIEVYLTKSLRSHRKYTLVIFTTSKETIDFKTNDKGNISMSIISTKNNHLTKMTKIVMSILLIYSIFLTFMLLFGKIQVNKLFILSALVIGTLITTILPIGNVPDEANAHIATAYHYSNVILGVEDSDLNNVKIRKCDKDIFNYIYVNTEVMEKYIEDIRLTHSSNEMMISSNYPVLSTKFYSFTYYLSAIGIAIGRLLHLNGIICLLMGRYFNFMFFLFVAYFCANHIKTFKEVIYFICLLPLTLQQACSLSYDSMVIALSLLIVTETVNLFYDKHLDKKNLLILFASCILLIPCKSFAYSLLLLAPLSFLLTKMDVEKIKKYFTKTRIVFCLIIILLLGLCTILICRKLFLQSSFLYLIGHPVQLAKVLYCTLYTQLNNYLIMMIASMGLLNIDIYEPINILYYMYIAYVLVKMRTDLKLNSLTRFIFVMIFFISAFGILMGMYSWSYSVGYTDLVQSSIIIGFQGRYIFPILAPLMIGIVKYGKTEDIFLNCKVIGFSSLLGVFVIISFMYY